MLCRLSRRESSHVSASSSHKVSHSRRILVILFAVWGRTANKQYLLSAPSIQPATTFLGKRNRKYDFLFLGSRTPPCNSRTSRVLHYRKFNGLVPWCVGSGAPRPSSNPLSFWSYPGSAAGSAASGRAVALVRGRLLFINRGETGGRLGCFGFVF